MVTPFSGDSGEEDDEIEWPPPFGLNGAGVMTKCQPGHPLFDKLSSRIADVELELNLVNPNAVAIETAQLK